jgi:type II restriction enzyme
MSIELADYETKVAEAIKAFWGNREAAQQKQVESGKADQGERGKVTAGKNMDGFLALVKDIVYQNGLDSACIFVNRSVLTLPGYFRPTKLWDMLVMNKGRLIAAIELKSQVGPSFGNNFNNRTEEAIGTAKDFWIAYREKAFGESVDPFVGWLILLEDCEKSRTPVRESSHNFPIFPDFKNISYAQRYEILCRKLVQERLYTSAAFLRSPRTAVDTGEFSELSEMTSLKTFIITLAAHIAAEAARSK